MIKKCEYCGSNARRVTGDYIYRGRMDLAHLNFWYCDNGHPPAYVGCHKKNIRLGRSGFEHLGRLADKELRFHKQMAHHFFDPLWMAGPNKKFKSRKSAYSWLSNKLGIERSMCHIGMFDVSMCKMVVEVCANEL